MKQGLLKELEGTRNKILGLGGTDFNKNLFVLGSCLTPKQRMDLALQAIGIFQ